MNVVVLIVVTAAVTYGLRAIPLVAMRRQIESAWVQSFLFYVPWAVLTAMTIPAIFFATNSLRSAIAGLVVALVLAIAKRSLFTVALGAGVAVWLVEYTLL